MSAAGAPRIPRVLADITRVGPTVTLARDVVVGLTPTGRLGHLSRFRSEKRRRVYATYGNFGGSHVFKSSDGGNAWQALDGTSDLSLPDVPVHSIVIDPDDTARLYLGTDLGVFVSVDGGQRWMLEETGFGPVVTEWLSLIRDTSGRKRLFAFHSRTRSVAR